VLSLEIQHAVLKPSIFNLKIGREESVKKKKEEREEREERGGNEWILQSK
jgi:hypothetical protein